MRVLLFTGKGGVGKTTIAAATAVRAAKAGRRTLVMSTDPAHSLADSFDIELGPSAREIAPNLWAEQIDAHQHDLLIVDCAPTAETLRLLSLPEIMNWYIERIFPVERRVVKTIRPMLTKITSLPIAEDRVFGAVERLHRNLDAVRRILNDEKISSVRLVVNPEKMVISEARRTYTYLSLFGYRVDSVVVNRIIPDDVTDPYFGKWKEIQAEHLASVPESFEPLPIVTARLFDREMVGLELLQGMGEEVYGDREVTSILHREDPIRIRKRGPSYLLAMRLPFASRDDLDIHRRGDELLIKVGSYKRTLILPQTLQRLAIREASFVEDRLEIRFARESGASQPAGMTTERGSHG